MAWQTSANVLVALKEESTTGTAPATVTGAVRLRIIDSPGLELKRGEIQSAEARSDMWRAMGRLGGKSVDGSYNTELTVGGGQDALIEAVMRSTWVTGTAIDFATLTTVAVSGTNVLTAAGGDLVGTQGMRVGDLFRLSGTGTAANNNVWQQVITISSLSLTCAPGGLTSATAAATGTIIVARKVISATTPSRAAFTVEQYDTDIDLSELFLGCRVVGLKLSFQPNAMAQATWTFMGMDHTALATGTSPFYTDPLLTTSVAMVADDSTIRYNGAAITQLTGFDLDFAITANGQPVIGSVTPVDVFDGVCAVSGSVTGLRDDFSNLTLFDAETEFAISILLRGTGTAPVDAMSIYLPRVKISSLSAPVGGGSEGAKVETLGIMCGPKTAATGYDGTVASICSSATA